MTETILVNNLLQDEQLKQQYTNILNYIKQYETIIIHRHVSPDPDALGSQLGLAQVIRDNFPQKKVYCVGENVTGLMWIGEMDTISDDIYQNALVIVIDTANSPRIDDSRYTLGQFLIKIDHHPIVEQYGNLNVVDTTASSASEMVAQFIFSQHLTISDASAKYIYTGICGDTGRFLFNNTTATTMAIVAKLREYHFDATEINNAMITKSLQEARLCGYVLQHLQGKNGVAHVVLTNELLNEFQLTIEETSSIVGLPGTVKGIISWVIFIQQEDGTYRARLRSKGPVINGIASQFDGGGHPLASGANAKTDEDIIAIVSKLEKAVFDYRKEENNEC